MWTVVGLRRMRSRRTFQNELTTRAADLGRGIRCRVRITSSGMTQAASPTLLVVFPPYNVVTSYSALRRYAASCSYTVSIPPTAFGGDGENIRMRTGIKPSSLRDLTGSVCITRSRYDLNSNCGGRRSCSYISSQWLLLNLGPLIEQRPRPLSAGDDASAQSVLSVSGRFGVDKTCATPALMQVTNFVHTIPGTFCKRKATRTGTPLGSQ